ncbi:splicing factor 3A subunit 3-like [Elysia marginata]|uniref:Splicing factor 3A subunit 3-like n=1 Tax=Elysia marginata TaxID=1093978 RepID=A0AAV4JQU5_9GAST|nr:splicing factor 3A subunit 3-like [Elysia marginata]
MESILEQQRRCHEERERVMGAMTSEMLLQKKTQREQINSDHRLKMLHDRYAETTSELKELYEDKDGVRKEEIQTLAGPNEYAEFKKRLNAIESFYRQHPNEVSIPMSIEFDELAKQRENPPEEATNMVEFTDEEGYGKYLDLHKCYERYLNLKGIEKIDYITYLSTFDHLYDVPKERKNASYREYLVFLLDYLGEYISKIKPLTDLNEEVEQVQSEFERIWIEGMFPGWPKETSGALTHSGAHLDLSAFSSWEELASLGLDRLKSALMALGVKCGGTLEQRAQRLFSTKGKSLDELDPALFAKSKPGKAGKASKNKDTEKQREIALLEAQVYRLSELLSEQRSSTRDNVQRKQAQTGEEREESDEEKFEESDSDEDADDTPYNPKDLPLGWDGKPIPYWLYKLHGLNLTYTCEICGNYAYKGPKAFQRHFAESRHALGMRCLGIPNTAHFANVTSIEDALALWTRIKSGKESERWKADTEEEYEDSQGNIINKKMYTLLKKEGIL